MKSNTFCIILIALLFGSYTQTATADESKLYSYTINDSSSSAELKALLMDSIKNISTYKYSANISSQIEIDPKNSINKSNYTMISLEKGIVNLTGQSMSSIQRLSEIPEGYNSVSMINEFYLFNKTLYKRLDNTWSQTKVENAERLINNINIIYNESKMLNNSEINLLGFKEIDGEECYWIRVKPDMRSFASILLKSRLDLPMENIDLEKLFSNSIVEWTTWITRDAHYLKKNDIKVILSVTPDDLGFAAKSDANVKTTITARANTLYNDHNQPILLNFSKEFKDAYPFPIRGASATLFGVIQEDTAADEYSYSYDKERIYIDVAALGHLNANLIDVDDRYYEPVYGNTIGNSEREFLTFELPNGTIIKKIRFEPDNNYREAGSPFALDLRLDQLGSVIRNPIKKVGFNASDNDIYIDIYSIDRRDEYHSSSERFLIDLVIDLKITNNGAIELPLDLDDFSIIDQFGWTYLVSDSGSSNLGSLLQGESRRFDVIIPDVSELSDPVIFKYKNLRMDIV